MTSGRLGQLILESKEAKSMKSPVLSLLYLKSCPRCRGDMCSDKDYYGAYKMCLQCGYMIDLDREGKSTVASRVA